MAVFVGLLVILIAPGVLRHAFPSSLGVRSGTAMLLLLDPLVGDILNIPIAALPPEQVLKSDKVIEFFGMEYTVPVVQNLPGTVIAINVGGAVIPTIMSIYLLSSRRLWVIRRYRHRQLSPWCCTGLPIRFPASASRCRFSCRP